MASDTLVPIQGRVIDTLAPIQGTVMSIKDYEWQYEGECQGQRRWMAMSPEFNKNLEMLYQQFLDQAVGITASQVQHEFKHEYHGNTRRGKITYTVDFKNHVQSNNWNERSRIRRVGIVVVFGPEV